MGRGGEVAARIALWKEYAMKYRIYIMNNLYILASCFFVLFIQNIFAQGDDDFGKREIRESLQRYHATLENIDRLQKSEAIIALGDMMVRTYRWQDEKSMDVFTTAQSKLLSIPEHATYYRDQINTLREQLQNGHLELEKWASAKQRYFQVLKLMPSEEAVAVLGEFAVDQFAFEFSKDPKDMDVPGLKEYDYRHVDYMIDFTVCIPAALALENLIENPPASPGLRDNETQALWSQWWREVKTGKRKYRFKGSSIEHPINPPPGTFREPRRPEKHPSPQSCATEKTPASVPTQAAAHATSPGARWPVIAGVVALLLATLIFLRKIMSR